jgi:hypothetical protein
MDDFFFSTPEVGDFFHHVSTQKDRELMRRKSWEQKKFCRAQDQGCQIFVATTYQNGEKYQIARKYVYQMAIRYTKWL